jgi:hypothetical protein
MPTVHESLDESLQRCAALADEIEKYKQTRILNQEATQALEATSTALCAVVKEIKPITTMRIRRMTIFLAASMGMNTLFFIVILWLCRG